MDYNFYYHPSSVGYGFHPLEWVLSGSRSVNLFISPSSVPLFCARMCCRQDGIVNQRFRVGLVFTFLLWYCAEYLPVHETLIGRVKTLCRHQFKFSKFNESHSCCLQPWGLTIKVWRATYSLGRSLHCRGFP